MIDLHVVRGQGQNRGEQEYGETRHGIGAFQTVEKREQGQNEQEQENSIEFHNNLRGISDAGHPIFFIIVSF
jgi:hypothetical protein